MTRGHSLGWGEEEEEGEKGGEGDEEKKKKKSTFSITQNDHVCYRRNIQEESLDQFSELEALK